MYVEYMDEKSGNNNEVSQPYFEYSLSGYFVLV